ncbi:hypothetical protein E2C01_041026 [Portunus trituberculatus]|uniref:Uncharacterized protein n=1 Tax=Portunus trituberculatus TaxID=210409 RepID=A0A5B7FP71_PORTR|nr:hypothetical protein [Portunus trituberculatus]
MVSHCVTTKHVPTVHQQPTRRVGSIADYDPVNEQYGSITQHNANPAGGGYRQETTYQVQRTNLYGDQNMGQQPPPSQMNSNATHHKVTAPPTQLGVSNAAALRMKFKICNSGEARSYFEYS